MPSSLNDRFTRGLLLGPDAVARAAARAARVPEEGWMLRQPRDVRASYVREVLDAGGETDPRLQERWMLTQDDRVRLSYVREVLDSEAPR